MDTTLTDAARAMGRARSARKAAAARANGMLGGRPRRKPAQEQPTELQPISRPVSVLVRVTKKDEQK